MTSRIICTLDPHRVGANLTLNRGNLDVTTTGVCDIHRSVFGTVAAGAGQFAYQVYFWSNSRPAAGLANLCSAGIAEVGCRLNKYAGEQALSWGLRPTEAAVYNNDAVISGSASPALQPIGERRCIGVFLDMTGGTPICAWLVNGNLIFQANLTAGKFYVPAISIGSDSPGNITASLNFGQSLFDFPNFSVLK